MNRMFKKSPELLEIPNEVKTKENVFSKFQALILEILCFQKTMCVSKIYEFLVLFLQLENL